MVVTEGFCNEGCEVICNLKLSIAESSNEFPSVAQAGAFNCHLKREYIGAEIERDA
jgi:hypothetical protein